MNEGLANILLRTPEALDKYLEKSRQVGAATAYSAEVAEEYQQTLIQLTKTFENLGRVLTNVFGPSAAKFMTAFADEVRSIGAAFEKLRGWLGQAGGSDNHWAADAVDDWLKKIIGGKGRLFGALSRSFQPDTDTVAAPPNIAETPRGTMSDAEIEAYIRKAAIARGIDPEVAIKVWNSEGRYGVGPSKQSTVVKNGVREQSFGPFQLYMGGGLGNTFQKQTGLDPRDPTTFAQQIDFSLDEAKRGGWGPWYGWKGGKWAGIQSGAPQTPAGAAGGGSSTNNNITVQNLNVNVPNGDPATIARGVDGQLRRLIGTANADTVGSN
jgi:hypothetical protein